MRYTYDSLNRLTREDNKNLDYSYTYSYDVNGNILLKEIYRYSTGELTQRYNSFPYQYNDNVKFTFKKTALNIFTI